MPTAIEIFKEKLNLIAESETQLSANVLAHQLKIYSLILDEFYPLFDLKDGVIISSYKNDTLLNSIDELFDKLGNALNRDILTPVINNILNTAKLSGEYYKELGFTNNVVNTILNDKVALTRKLGFTVGGNLNKNGYLYQLGKTAQVRQQLKDYVLSSLTGDVPFLQFQQGFKNLIVGNKNVSGAMAKYFDQYAVDSFAQIDSFVNKQIAHELNLSHFIYEGSIIKTTRAFCRKRAGKAYKVSDTVTWKDDSTLPDQKTKARYNPLIDRGRYRCRHGIRYITKALYDEFIKKQS